MRRSTVRGRGAALLRREHPLAGTVRTGPPRPEARWWRGDAGMVSAEYAVGILAAVAFAMVLLAVMKSSAVKTALTSIVTGALTT